MTTPTAAPTTPAAIPPASPPPAPNRQQQPPQQPTAPAFTADVPSGVSVPDKFKTTDGKLDIAKVLSSYTDLETRQSQTPPNQPGQQQPPATPATPSADLFQRAKDDFFNNNGQISDGLLGEFERAGFSRDSVTEYANVMRQQAQANFDLANTKMFGGKLQDALNWATDGMSKPEHEEFHRLVRNKDTMRMGLLMLKSAWELSTGQAGEGVADFEFGDGARGPAGDVFKTREEYDKATLDPRYRSDPDFMKEVDAKMERSYKHWSK